MHVENDPKVSFLVSSPRPTGPFSLVLYLSVSFISPVICFSLLQ